MLPLITAAAVELFFDFDSARLPEGTADRMAELVSWAKDHPTQKLVVDGNADSVGSQPYNVALSLRRARNVKAQLTLSGVSSDQIVIVGYGEDGLRRSMASLDRRVTVWTTDEPLYTIIDNAFTRATAVLWDKPVDVAQIDGPRATQTAFR
jgi:outer membrane protein OmpA-like peptidoglycan-associated protein